MKRERSVTFRIAAALAFAISFGGAACLITGFSMDNRVRFDGATANVMAVALFCGVFSIAAAVWFSTRWGWHLLAGAAVVCTGFLWYLGVLDTALEALLYRLTVTYHSAYGTPVVLWTGQPPLMTAPNIGICLLAALPAAAVARTVCRRKNAVAAVGLGLLPLLLCIVVTDTVPDNWCIFLLFSGLALLMLTNTVRRRSARDGNRLTALLLVPVLLASSLLFWAVPRQGYQAQSEEMQQKMLSWLQELPFVQMDSSGRLSFGFGGTTYGDVNLAAVGAKENFPYAIMDVTGPKTELLYLRGQSLDEYTGLAWNASKASTGADGGWVQSAAKPVGELTIKTRAVQPMYFFPYYPDAAFWDAHGSFTGGSIANSDRLRSYTIGVTQRWNGTEDMSLGGMIRSQCLQLPDSTRVQAESILRSIGVSQSTMSRAKIVEAIKRYVMNSADYSLMTGRMPSHEDDFAIWFLKEADSGYCIHFASAAVVLLRAAGVPARYVTGYVVNAVAGESVTVTADRSHAWVEYYTEDLGWVMMDPTPAEFNTQPEDTRPPQTTEPEDTRPPQTTGPEDTEPHATEPSTDPGVDNPTRPTTPNGGGSQGQKVDLSGLWRVLKGMLWTAGICAAVIGQYILRLRCRKKKMHTGHPNQRVLALWREVRRYCRILGQKPPERLLSLAEKARFSQHTMTEAERMEFADFLTQRSAQLRGMKWYKQWPVRLLWAVE